MINPVGIELLEDTNIELCVNYIEEGRCILFLGPQFTIDAAGKKIHEKLKIHLQESNFKEKIDLTYDNLFIFKDSKPQTGEKMRLNIELKKVYKSVAPHEIYEKIPQIPFSAIISCSPDHFLREAFKNNELDVYFHYYSRKGAIDKKENVSKEVTFLYNIFGYVSDEDSLITTYEGFFKFIISIMGEEQQLPLELRNRIVDAKIFIFMGFDLTKWYIPLLVHKLNSFKQEDYYTTALINKDNTLNEDTAKHFPIEMIVLNGESIPTIYAIHEKMRINGTLRTKAQDDADEVKTLKKWLAGNKLEEVIEKLKKCYQDKGLEENDIIATEARYEELKQKIRKDTISEADARLERSKIVNALLDFIDCLK